MKADDLLPDLLPDVPGCPRVTAREHLVKAAQQFARDTHAWDVEAERFTVKRELRIIDLPLPQKSALVAVTKVTIDDKPVAHEWVDDAVTLLGDEEGLLVVRVSLEPTADSTEIAPQLARYRDAILDYARMRLLMMPRQEWTNPELGFAFRRQYDDRVTDSRVELARSRTTQPLRTKPQVGI